MSLKGTAENENILKGKINLLKVIHKDAYEVAVENGFDGTKEEWLKKLVGDSEVLASLLHIHAWEKSTCETIGEEEKEKQIISYYNPGSTNDLTNNVWDTVSYSDTIDIVDGELVLVNPVSFVMSKDSDYNVVKGKYIKTGYNNCFYRIPKDTTLYHENPYANTNYIRAREAMLLSVVGRSLMGYVVSDEADSYPTNGEQSGYWYEYIGLTDEGRIDTSDATAEASDIAAGKTAYKDGEKVTGKLKDGGDLTLIGGTPSMYIDFNGGSGVVATAETETDMILRAGDKVEVVTAYDQFGDATPENVAKGKTFTSASGLKVKGTHECGGVELPPLSNPGAASDLAAGKELYDDEGKPIAGTLGEVAKGQMLGANQNKRMVFNSNRIRIAADTTGEAIVRPGATLMTDIPASEFGDATAEDVAKGKTFTSASGIKVTGTHECGGGFTVTDDGAGNVTITSSAITDNDGDVVIA